MVFHSSITMTYRLIDIYWHFLNSAFYLRSYLDPNFSELGLQQRDVLVEHVLLQLDVGGPLLKHDLQLRNDLGRRLEVVAPVMLRQLALATGQLVTAFAEEQKLLGLKILKAEIFQRQHR